MKKCIFVCYGICLFLFSLNLFATAATTPVGDWKTIDDVTHQPKAIIHIWEAPDHLLYGRISTFFPSAHHDQKEVCHECEGARHNQPIMGMVILAHLAQSKDNKNEWVNGDILDPNNGKVYHCQVVLSEDGETLFVRGYIGIPLFGRSQTWLRLNLNKAN